ncbi:MAG: delta-60 repeat domain-containing protein [Xanthomonadales bacterium]|nr:delta-60 repeat domain-containing protein [Xanthomonadales bacterium]
MSMFRVRPLWVAALLVTALLSLASPGFAQTLQSTPNVSIVSNGFVYALAPMPDGDWIIGGEFESINGVARKNLARINADGSVDMAWNPGADDRVGALAANATGDVFVGGSFTSVGGFARTHLAKLTGASAVVSMWQPGVAPEAVGALAVDSGGRLLVGGRFGSGPSATYLKRFSAVTGAVDASFSAAPDAWVRKVLVEASGSVLIAGDFANISGNARRGIARLDGNGQLLASFDAASNGTVTAIAIGSGGALYVGGYFTEIGGTPRSGLAKLGSTGSTDANWTPGGINGPVNALTLEGDHLYIGGMFTLVGGNPCKNLVRVDALGSGALDAGWALQADGEVRAVGATASGEIWLVGAFKHLGTSLRMGLARLDTAGTLAPRIDAELPGEVSSILPVAGGAAIVAGRFLKVDGAAHRHIARFASNGSVDHAFQAQADATIFALAPNGSRFFAGGAFTTINGSPRSRLAKLDAITGALDATWTPAPNYIVRALTNADGALFVGGDFTSVSGISRRSLAKLATDGAGSVDTGFDAAIDGSVSSLLGDGLGHVLVYGGFNQIGGTTRAGLGMVDASNGSALAFDVGVLQGRINAMATDTAGRVYLAGNLESAQGTSLCGLARFDGSSGVLDPRWLPFVNYGVGALRIVAGAAYVGGGFSSVSGQPRRALVKLSLTSPFPEWQWVADVTGGNYPWVSAIAAVGSSIWVGGEFASVAGQPRAALAAVAPGAQTLFGDGFEQVPGDCVAPE